MSAARPAASPSVEPKPVSLERLNDFVASVMKEVVKGQFSAECYAVIEAQRKWMLGVIATSSKAATVDVKAEDLNANMAMFAGLIHDVANIGSVLSKLKGTVHAETYNHLEKLFEKNVLLLKSSDSNIVNGARKQLHELSERFNYVSSILNDLERLKSVVSLQFFKRVKEFFETHLGSLVNADAKTIDNSSGILKELSVKLNYWLSLAPFNWPLNSDILSNELMFAVQKLEEGPAYNKRVLAGLNDYENLRDYIRVYVIHKGHDSTAVTQTLNVLSPGVKEALQKVQGAKGSRMLSGTNTGDQIFAYIGHHKNLGPIAIELRENIIKGNYNDSKDRFVFAMKALARIKPEFAYQVLHAQDAKQMPAGKDLLKAVNHTEAEKFYDAQQAAKKAPAAVAASPRAKK